MTWRLKLQNKLETNGRCEKGEHARAWGKRPGYSMCENILTEHSTVYSKYT